MEDYIPAPLYDQSNCDLALMDTNIYFFLKSMCDELLQTATVHLDACLPTGYLAQSMDVPRVSPLVTLRSLFYTQSSTPILYSEEYYNTKLIPFSFQKRILTGKFNREQPPIELLLLLCSARPAIASHHRRAGTLLFSCHLSGKRHLQLFQRPLLDA